MAIKTVFEHAGYKSFLRELVKFRRGEKLKLSQFLKCNPGYISQVLNAEAQLSLEQAERACRFFSLTEDEARFFLLLVQKDRAGTRELEAVFSQQIRQILDSRMQLKNRLDFTKSVSKEHQAIYYSSWHYVGIHMALALPELKTKRAVSSHLGLPLKRVSEVVAFLIEAGLIEERGDYYYTGPVSIHLGSDSALLSKHHANWRMKAVESLDASQAQDLHYSSIVTIAKSDVTLAREILVRAVEEVRSLIRNSKEDSLYCYCLDLFSLEREI